MGKKPDTLEQKLLEESSSSDKEMTTYSDNKPEDTPKKRGLIGNTLLLPFAAVGYAMNQTAGRVWRRYVSQYKPKPHLTQRHTLYAVGAFAIGGTLGVTGIPLVGLAGTGVAAVAGNWAVRDVREYDAGNPDHRKSRFNLGKTLLVGGGTIAGLAALPSSGALLPLYIIGASCAGLYSYTHGRMGIRDAKYDFKNSSLVEWYSTRAERKEERKRLRAEEKEQRRLEKEARREEKRLAKEARKEEKRKEKEKKLSASKEKDGAAAEVGEDADVDTEVFYDDDGNRIEQDVIDKLRAMEKAMGKTPSE